MDGFNNTFEQAPGAVLRAADEVIREIDDQVILNFQGRWRSASGFQATAGVDNLTDELAPLIYATATGFTDGRTYALGRFYYVRLGFKPGAR